MTELTRPAAPAYTTQGTSIEQTRAATEAAGEIYAAQQNPRNLDYAREMMRAACSRIELAARAHYTLPQGGKKVEGGSVALARELAVCWGHITHGVTELFRDDTEGRSEILAYAKDLQSNTSARRIAQVPHVNHTATGARKRLVSGKDVLDNNNSVGSRLERGVIFAVLPRWFVAEAEELCKATVKADAAGGKSLPQSRDEAVTGWARKGVTADRLVAFIGRPVAAWTEDDVVTLRGAWNAVKDGVSTVAELFPPDRSLDALPARAPVEAPPAPGVGLGYGTDYPDVDVPGPDPEGR